MDSSDVRKLIGTPKLVCILGKPEELVGGPGSGKGTQCAKLVEEFGYLHISVGDLMRDEIKKGSKEGDLAKSLVSQGKLVPTELTVGLLVKAMIAKPAKNYLIDGFPREVDQALYFEKNVMELQTILFYDAPEEVMEARMKKRAEHSGRDDDNPESFKKRIDEFNSRTRPVVDFYNRFGKIRFIDAKGEVNQIYNATKQALLPQVDCIFGPSGSGKTSIANQLAQRANLKIINFSKLVWDNYRDKRNDDEYITQQLIDRLRNEIAPRVLLEEFPQNLLQAKYFIRNCVKPGHIFYLNASQDTCQSRMVDVGKESTSYIPSAELASKNAKLNSNLAPLLSYLKSRHSDIFHEINAEHSFKLVQQEVCKLIEPVIIHIRHGNNNKLKRDVLTSLQEESQFINLEVAQLMSDETNRGTKIGQEFQRLLSSGKIVPASLTVNMLQKIVYSGAGSKRFLLNGFPDIIEQAQEFEENCAHINFIIFPTVPGQPIELNLNLFNLDTYFQKEGRLKVLDKWNPSVSFEEQLGKKLRYHAVVGGPRSGKTTISKHLAKELGWVLIDWAKVEEEAKNKKKKPEEEEQDEITVTEDEILNEAKSQICDYSKIYIVDGFLKGATDGTSFFSEIGTLPQSLIDLDCEDSKLEERFKKANEITEEISEEQKPELDKDIAAAHAIKQFVEDFAKENENVPITQVITSLSEEKGKNMALGNFLPRLVLLNHEKRFQTDTPASNLSLRHKFVYISVYQLIRKHIQEQTEFGKRLQESRNKQRIISLDYTMKDEFEEVEYSAALYDPLLVLEVVKSRIDEVKDNEKVILIEGMLNHHKLKSEDDRLQLRFMDEIFTIEKALGEVQSLILFNTGREDLEEDIVYEELPKPEVPEKEEKKAEEGEEEAPPEETEETKEQESFKVHDYQWSNTDGKPRPLGQLFFKYKQCQVCEVHPSDDFSNNHFDAVNAGLDSIMGRLVNGDLSDVTSLIQVVFRE